MTRRAAIVVGAFALSLVPACKKTVEGETKSWKRNLQRVRRMGTLYPGFSAALEARKKQAQEAMEAAKKVGDKEQAAKKMAAANSLLMSGFVGKLDSVDSKIRRLRSKALSASNGVRDRSDRMAVRYAADDARHTLKEVAALLRSGAESPAAANTILSKVESELRYARRNLERVIKRARDKRKKTGGAGGTTVKRGRPLKDKTTAPVKSTWKCSYCDHQNPASAAKCTNCNAPRGN